MSENVFSQNTFPESRDAQRPGTEGPGPTSRTMIEGAAFAADELIEPKRLQRGCMYLALLAWRHSVCDLDSRCVCGEYYISTTFEFQFNCTCAITFKFEFEPLIRRF